MSLTGNFCQLILITSLTAGGLPRAAAEGTVFAAASLMENLREIGSGYESQTGQAILFNFAGSSTLAATRVFNKRGFVGFPSLLP
jgi:ABC-type molybdate transport system substrate-binding protein